MAAIEQIESPQDFVRELPAATMRETVPSPAARTELRDMGDELRRLEARFDAT